MLVDHLVSVFSDIRAGIRLAVRSGFFSLAIWVLLALIAALFLAAEFSSRQPATVALDVGLSIIRILVPIYSVLMVQELVTREFERKLYLTALTYPRPRAHWLLGRLCAVALLSFFLFLAMSIVLLVLVNILPNNYDQLTPVSLGVPYFVTLGFSLVDLIVVISIALLLSVSTTTPTFVLIGTLGFVLIARSYMPIIQLLQGADYLVEKLANPKLYKDSLHVLNFIVPDLGTMDVRMIALYNRMEFLPAQWPFLLAGALAYSFALIGISIWRVNTREFN